MDYYVGDIILHAKFKTITPVGANQQMCEISLTRFVGFRDA